MKLRFLRQDQPNQTVQRESGTSFFVYITSNTVSHYYKPIKYSPTNNQTYCNMDPNCRPCITQNSQSRRELINNNEWLAKLLMDNVVMSRELFDLRYAVDSLTKELADQKKATNFYRAKFDLHNSTIKLVTGSSQQVLQSSRSPAACQSHLQLHSQRH